MEKLNVEEVQAECQYRQHGMVDGEDNKSTLKIILKYGDKI
jgi:hypothetical protein